MKANDQNSPGSERSAAIASAAAEWVMRLDRGLTPSEQDDYLQWLAADPRHGEAIAGQRRTWEAFDRLAGLQACVEAVPDPDLLAPRRQEAERVLAGPAGAGSSSERTSAEVSGALIPAPRAWRWIRLVGPLAAAAALALVFGPHQMEPFGPSQPAVGATHVHLTTIEERTLADGSTLRLNRGASVAVEFSPGERRVRLERGEAAFTVAKDAARPFVVAVAGVTVRAVGTAFNVRHDDDAVDVIVTEGRVAVARDAEATPAVSTSVVTAGQRVVMPLDGAGEPPRVSTPPPEEIARRLAWQPRMLTFSDEPLPVILNEFNRHNPVALRLDDSNLQELRLSARFRSDNVRGFLRLLESEFGVRAHAQANGEIALRMAR